MSGKLHFERHEVGPLMENCYLLAGPGTGALLVDPGDEAQRLWEAVGRSGRELEAILLTHAHFDHVGALSELLEMTSVPVYLHPEDRVVLEHASAYAAAWGIEMRQPQVETIDLAHGQRLILAGLEIDCLYTPGHAPGHIAFHLPEYSLVLAGDALFRASIGRTDLPLCDRAQLLASIRRELLTLPSETIVWPGHGPETSIADEAKGNPFLVSGEAQRR